MTRVIEIMGMRETSIALTAVTELLSDVSVIEASMWMITINIMLNSI